MIARAAITRNVEARGLIPLLGTIPVVTVEIRLQPGYIPSDDRDDGADPVVAI
jgi:hypothetical protein